MSHACREAVVVADDKKSPWSIQGLSRRVPRKPMWFRSRETAGRTRRPTYARKRLCSMAARGRLPRITLPLAIDLFELELSPRYRVSAVVKPWSNPQASAQRDV